MIQGYETAPGLKDTPFFTGEAAPAKKVVAKKVVAKKVRTVPCLFTLRVLLVRVRTTRLVAGLASRLNWCVLRGRAPVSSTSKIHGRGRRQGSR